jgi:hypothetical protein
MADGRPVGGDAVPRNAETVLANLLNAPTRSYTLAIFKNAL